MLSQQAFNQSLFIASIDEQRKEEYLEVSNLFESLKNDLAYDFRHQRDPTNGPFIEDDYNEAKWALEDILMRQPPCTR